MNTKYILIGIAVSAVVTFALRALPFVIFNVKRQMPEMLVKLGKVLPATIMAVLIVYCLKGAGATGIPRRVGVLVTGGTYKWRHNTLLSILLGTVSYMVMLRLV